MLIPAPMTPGGNVRTVIVEFPIVNSGWNPVLMILCPDRNELLIELIITFPILVASLPLNVFFPSEMLDVSKCRVPTVIVESDRSITGSPFQSAGHFIVEKSHREFICRFFNRDFDCHHIWWISSAVFNHDHWSDRIKIRSEIVTLDRRIRNSECAAVGICIHRNGNYHPVNRRPGWSYFDCSAGRSDRRGCNRNGWTGLNVPGRWTLTFIAYRVAAMFFTGCADETGGYQ